MGCLLGGLYTEYTVLAEPRHEQDIFRIAAKLTTLGVPPATALEKERQ